MTTSFLHHATFSLSRRAWTVYAGHRLDLPFERVTGYHATKAQALDLARLAAAAPDSLGAQLAMDFSHVEDRVLSHMTTSGKLVAEDARDRFHEAFPKLKAWHDGMGTVTGRLSQSRPEPQYLKPQGISEQTKRQVAEIQQPRPKNSRHLPQGDLAARTGDRVTHNFHLQAEAHNTPDAQQVLAALEDEVSSHHPMSRRRPSTARLNALKDRFK